MSIKDNLSNQSKSNYSHLKNPQIYNDNMSNRSGMTVGQMSHNSKVNNHEEYVNMNQMAKLKRVGLKSAKPAYNTYKQSSKASNKDNSQYNNLENSFKDYRKDNLYENYNNQEILNEMNNVMKYEKKDYNNRVTSLNSGPFSIHLLENHLRDSKRPFTATKKNFNKHNCEIIPDFQKRTNSKEKRKKVGKYTTDFEKKYSMGYLNKLKKLEDKTKHNDFNQTQRQANFFLERNQKKYDGFESFNIPNTSTRCKSARPDATNLYDKNYYKLITSISSVDHKPIADETDVVKICSKENQKLLQIVSGNNRINELSMGVKTSSLLAPSIYNIINAPKLIIRRTGLGGASRQMGDVYTPGLVSNQNSMSNLTKRNCWGGLYQY